MSVLFGKSYRERAEEAKELAARTRDPQVRKACLELAAAWSRLARRSETQSRAAGSRIDMSTISEPLASE